MCRQYPAAPPRPPLPAAGPETGQYPLVSSHQHTCCRPVRTAEDIDAAMPLPTCCCFSAGTVLKYRAANVSSQPEMFVGMGVGRGTSSQLWTAKPDASSRLCVAAAEAKFHGLPALWLRPCWASTAANATRTCKRSMETSPDRALVVQVYHGSRHCVDTCRAHRQHIPSTATVHDEAAPRTQRLVHALRQWTATAHGA
jgi:hypothetical protein